MIRLELFTPKGDLVTADTYNRLFTLHGVVMVWFFLVPSIPATLGNFLLPLMIGARDLAFPRLNLMSWYSTSPAGCFTLAALLLGGVDTGWTFYTPFSTIYSNSYVLLAALGIFVVGFSSIATGLNFIATVHLLRAQGMTWFRLPLFVWAMYATSLVMVLATPVLAMSDAAAGAPSGSSACRSSIRALGGDPLLFQHLFWFYSHPAVYIMILPAMGVVSEVIACGAAARLRLSVHGLCHAGDRGASASSSGATTCSSRASALRQHGLRFLSFVIAVPSAIKVFNWTGTLYRGQIRFSAPMLYALGFVGLFTHGRADRADPRLDPGRRARAPTPTSSSRTSTTSWSAARCRPSSAGCTSGGPRSPGGCIRRAGRSFAAIMLFFGFNFTFFPQFILGYLGMPRRYSRLSARVPGLHVMSSSGAVILAVGYLMPLFYLAWSLRYGEPAPRQSVGRDGAGVAHRLAAAEGELQDHPRRRQRSLPVPPQGRGAPAWRGHAPRTGRDPVGRGAA